MHFECFLAVIHDAEWGRYEVYRQLFVIPYVYFGSCQLSVVNCILLHLTSILLHCVWLMNVYMDLMCLTLALCLLNRVY